MGNIILLCTVGGSHQPILEAIRSNSPDYVCFFCTDRDQASGKPGSIGQVIGKGNVIKANPEDGKPTLPNIPTQAGLDGSKFKTCKVPADDLDGAFFAMRAAIVDLTQRFPGARLVADYTGGTKTMTAALVCAALDRDDIDLQLVTGARADLVRVADRTEQTVTASVTRLRLDRAMAPYLEAWRRFAYREAAVGLEGIRATADAPDGTRLQFARALSHALALWHDFDHVRALGLIEPYVRRVAPCYPDLLPALRLLTHEGNPEREPMRLFDLWLNAQRCAAQGRYDDAVARVYRLLEWTAQWQLRRRLGVETADFPRERLPDDVAVQPDRNGKFKLGLWSAWQVVKADVGMAGSAKAFIVEQENKLKDLLAIRNQSILAHGFQPIAEADWKQMQQWVKDHFLPLLCDLASEAGLKRPPKQLPTEFKAG